MAKQDDPELRERLAIKADLTFGVAASLTSNSRSINLLWASLLFQLARDIGGLRPTDMDDAENYLKRADKIYEITAPSSPTILDAELYAAWGKLHLLWAEHHCLILDPDEIEVSFSFIFA